MSEHPAKESIPELLAELTSRLSTSISRRTELGARGYTAHNILSLREALSWRTAELAQGAYDALCAGRLATAFILTRSTTESAALLSYLKDVLEKRERGKAIDDAKVWKMLAGTKKADWVAQGFPTPVHILAAIDNLDATDDDPPSYMRGRYDFMSEIAHPNLLGVVQLFSDFDDDHAHFGNSAKRLNAKRDSRVRAASSLLALALRISLNAHLSITDELLAFLNESEKP